MVEDAGFHLEITGLDASAENGLAERPNQTYGNVMRCMLSASELGQEYWSSALLYEVYIRNRLPHTELGMTPYEAMTGIHPNVKHLRIFGSKVYAKIPGKRKAKLDSNATSGRFLGFTATDKNITYIDDKSNHK